MQYQSLNLEAGDGVSFSADVSNVVTGVVSYALLIGLKRMGKALSLE
ncbi:MAG: hypothetical protein CM15mV124_590 [uncultured marine virus]|nr:MAG: hypothetical protein CM15mV124_590 [uncultured marine virus]